MGDPIVMPPASVTLYRDGSGHFDISANISQEKITRIRSELSEIVGSVRWKRVEVGFDDEVMGGGPSWRTVLRLTFCHMRLD